MYKFVSECTRTSHFTRVKKFLGRPQTPSPGTPVGRIPEWRSYRVQYCWLVKGKHYYLVEGCKPRASRSVIHVELRFFESAPPPTPHPRLRRLDLFPQLQTTSDAPGAPGLPPAKPGPVQWWKMSKFSKNTQNCKDMCWQNEENSIQTNHARKSSKYIATKQFKESMFVQLQNLLLHLWHVCVC